MVLLNYSKGEIFNMKESKGNNVLLTVIGIATLLIAVVGATFAYFTAVLSGEESDTTITINAGTLGVTFIGGAGIPVSNIYPRGDIAALTTGDAWYTKTFHVKGNTTSTTTIPYTLALVIDKNEFTANALKFTLELDSGSDSNGTTATAVTLASPTNIPASGSVSLCAGGTGTGQCSFAGPTGGEVTHTYILRIFFPDTGGNQNADQGKEFGAHIEITTV